MKLNATLKEKNMPVEFLAWKRKVERMTYPFSHKPLFLNFETEKIAGNEIRISVKYKNGRWTPFKFMFDNLFADLPDIYKISSGKFNAEKGDMQFNIKLKL